MRSRRLTRAAALAGALTVALAAPAPAADPAKNAATKVQIDYATDGTIDPCKHTSEELRIVQKLIPADLEQYAPDFPAAVAAALEARARGDCAGKKPQAAPVLPAVTAAPVVPTPTATPTPDPTPIPTKTVVPEPPQPPQAPAGTIPVAAKPDVALERAALATADNQAPAPVLALAILALLLATTALFLVSMRRLGWADERLAGARHAWREAAWRAGGAWQDFRDWLRLGR